MVQGQAWHNADDRLETVNNNMRQDKGEGI